MIERVWEALCYWIDTVYRALITPVANLLVAIWDEITDDNTSDDPSV